MASSAFRFCGQGDRVAARAGSFARRDSFARPRRGGRLGIPGQTPHDRLPQPAAALSEFAAGVLADTFGRLWSRPNCFGFPLRPCHVSVNCLSKFQVPNVVIASGVIRRPLLVNSSRNLRLLLCMA